MHDFSYVTGRCSILYNLMLQIAILFNVLNLIAPISFDIDLKVILHFRSDEHKMSKLTKKDKLNNFMHSSKTTGLNLNSVKRS